MKVQKGPELKEKPAYRVTMNGLARANLHTLMRDKTLRDRAFNTHGKAILAILKKQYKGPNDFDAILDIEEMLQERNPDRWSRKNLAPRLGMSVSKLNRILDDSGERAPQDLELSDLLSISREFEIPYSSLFAPSREQLEEDATLIFTDQDPELTISAHQWLSYSIGLGVIPGMDAVATNYNASLLTNARMSPDWDSREPQKPTSDSQILLNIEDGRRIKKASTSKVSPMPEIVAGNPFSPAASEAIAFDNSSLELEPVNAAKFHVLLMHDIREAIYILQDAGHGDSVQDIKNSHKKIEQDLAAIVISATNVGPTSSPLTKAHLVNTIEHMAIMIEHATLELTMNRNAKIE